MRSQTHHASDPPPLAIEGELTIVRAAALKPLLLREPAPVEIDLSGVTEIDTAGLQLLMLAKKSAQAAQRELRLVAHSAAVIDAFELLNLAAFFNDPLVMASRASASGARSNNPSAARPSHES